MICADVRRSFNQSFYAAAVLLSHSEALSSSFVRNTSGGWVTVPEHQQGSSLARGDAANSDKVSMFYGPRTYIPHYK